MKRKILFVHNKFGCFGGAEQYILEVATALKPYFELSFCYEETTGKNEELYREIFSDIGTGIKEMQSDLIFVHKCLISNKWHEIFKKRIPVVHMVHDHEGYCLRGSKTFPLSQKVCPYKAGLCCLFPGLAFLKRDQKGKVELRWPNFCEKKKMISLDNKCDLFLVASDYMKRTLSIQGFNSDRVKVLFGVPFVDEIEPIFSEKNIIVYIGQIIKGKGLQPLIEALAKVQVPFQLDIFGTGPDEGSCRALAKKLGIEKKILFHGFTSRQAMQETLRQATLGVVPSVWAEPFGKAGVEMMQKGLPVVGFDNGGIRDWLHDGVNGYLVPSFDLDTFAQKITSLLKDKALAKQLGQRAKLGVERDYDFDKAMNELGYVFNQMIDKGKKA